MKKLILFLHVSLDGFTARPDGQMDWVKINDDLFDLAQQRTEVSDTALYGRGTFELMDAYWPTAGDSPNASKHDLEHSAWYNKVKKIVVSTSLPNREDITVLRENVARQLREIKQGEGKNIVMFGSPTLAAYLIAEGLVDDYWLFQNPVVLGRGIPFWPQTEQSSELKLISSTAFANGVVCQHYQKV
ncbi:dihydrofolate reductase family protein [Mucilaginibacter boryungensis]|uniref:Dihydrofolate reductase family protein n=1 Tax=Mucilaginibacter boryungensis TaxID=768480 RepID=A0ABR9XEF8_9SPHI|nr:dihydrofolate reductase family protein [Mucilaginibacter boryungensis]MBE9665766.1 dihydrofolate reductase family protein [Mucilaginibacter boryungensis]